MTDIWGARLVRAMDDDEIGEVADASTDPDPGAGPWDAAPNKVADHIIAAAVLGYPTDEDTDAILTIPGALERLTRQWSVAPPSEALIDRAATNPALRRLLTSSGHARPHDQTRANAERPRHRAGDGRQPERLRSLEASGFALAAADSAGIRSEERWSGGRIIRQRLQDGSTVVTVEYTGTDTTQELRDDPHVVLLFLPTEKAEPLLLLILIPEPGGKDPAAGRVPLMGQAVVAAAAAIGELELVGPVHVSALTETELAALSDSVAWSRGPWNTAWRRVGQSAGSGTPLYEAVLRGTRHI